MTRRAWVYIGCVLLVGAVLSGLAALASPILIAPNLLTFVVLTALTILTQFFEAEAPGRQSYYPHLVFFFAGLLLLPPALFVLLVVIPHLVEWIRKRLAHSLLLRAWYIQPFNIATHVIAGMTVRWAFTTLIPATTLTTPVSLLAVTLGALIYVLLNHLLIGLALVLARGISLRESGVFGIANLLSDLVQLSLGYVVAALWQLNPWLILPALLPQVMIYRALMIPQLEQEARTDSKTGLWNARHFNELFSAELERAKRFDRPLALMMADLDLLRNINNTYGHLAGDVVIAGIGQVIRKTIREYDIAARFGGEEFCIVLLEAGLQKALAAAERLRRAVEATRFTIPTSAEPIHVTLSLGVACFPHDAATTTDLIHQADVAVYQAKSRGRNCVASAADVPHSVQLESAPVEDAPATTYAAAFARREIADNSARPAVEAPAAAPPENKEQAGPVASERNFPKAALPWFVGGAIAAGAALTLLGLLQNPHPDLAVIALLTALAVLAELFEVNVYEDNTVSVSVAIAFAAALTTGLPGVAAVSAGIALTHYTQKRPALYKTAFNWATHVLAGAAPALMIHASLASLQVSNLLVLGVLTVIVGLIYFGIDTGLIAVAMSLAQGSSLKTTWQEQFRWLFAHYLVLCVMGLILSIAYRTLGLPGVIVFSLPAFLTRYAQKQYVERTEENVRDLRRMNQELSLANLKIASASQAIRQFNDELFLTLSKIIDARDPDAAGHAAKVADYATAIAAEVGLVEQVEHIRQAALLHDIGKLGITERILNKPARLDAEEYAIIKTHAALGAEFLETCQGLRHLAPLIKHHHERWDGDGYPDGLRGEQIPIEARILAVCDAVDAMGSDRPYHQAIALDEIVAELERCAEAQFDPAVVQAFIRIAKRGGENFFQPDPSSGGRVPP